MSVLPVGFGGAKGYQIANSLRFRASASASLSRTPGAAGNRKLLSRRVRIKRGAQGSAQVIMSAGTASIDKFYFDSSDRLCLDVLGVTRLVTTQVFRDPTGWYVDVGFDLDVANGTAVSRAKILINGTEVAAYSTDSRASIANTDTNWNNTVVQYIGRDNAGSYFDGYMAEPIGVDGGTPTAYSSIMNGVRVPVAPSATYGTTGFYLKFNDGSSATTLCYDRSGNGNNWTPNNISTTAGVTYDWMVDTPTNNYATLNPLHPPSSNSTLQQGNLRAQASAGSINSQARGTQAIKGKTWFEFSVVVGGWTVGGIGVVPSTSESFLPVNSTSGVYYLPTGQKRVNGTNSAYGATWTTNDVISAAVDPSAETVEFFKNNVSQGSISATGLFASDVVPHGGMDDTGSNAVVFNFGQRPFAYTPPTGFKALCTANLPAVAIAKPSDHHQVKLDTGANIKGVMDALFSGNLMEWIKDRGNVNNHQLADIGRGLTAILQSNTTAAETTYSAPSGSSVGWGWKAGGTPVTNNDGSISSQVSANTAAGFSIVTATLSAANGAVGHGLSTAPKLIIGKRRNGTTDWPCYHANLSSAANVVYLNTTAAQAASATTWNSTAPTASVFSVGTGLTGDWVFYCFAEIPGYSKFGSYTGNGSADGPFVWCGFRPRYVLVKSSTAVDDWRIYDSARPGYNVMGGTLLADTTGAETTSAEIDFTSNGFKPRVATTPNAAQTYIFAAFAEHPFGGSNVSPAPAR